MKRLITIGLLLVLPLHAEKSDRVVERWNAEFLAAVRRQSPPPCLIARNLAILHLSIWRAVEKAGKGNEIPAVAGAAHEVCTTLFSGDRSGFDTLVKSYPEAKGEILAVARAEADKVMREREDDGSSTTVHYHPDLAPGVWERTTRNRDPELPQWGLVRPFVLKSADEFRPPPPPRLDSGAYARDVNEVRKIGGAESASRTKDQEEIARFWSDFFYTTSPAGRWNEITCKELEGRGRTVRDKARLFAILNVTLADAGIAAWDCKYHYRFWRPVSAIHESLDDRNDATHPDKSWDSLLPSPSHPDYVSGHSVFSAAAAAVLTRTLGVPKKRIVVTSREMPGVTRSFASYEEIAREAGRSRVYGGIHFSAANEQGALLGKKVAERVMGDFSGRSIE